MLPQARNFTLITPVVGAETRFCIFIKILNGLLVDPFEPQAADFANWSKIHTFVISDTQLSLFTVKIHKGNARVRIQWKWWLG